MSNHLDETEDNATTAQGKNARPSETLSVFQNRLSGKKGRFFWKGIEELAETKEFQDWVEDEFPNRATLFQADRRQFLTLGGAALAMAGLSGCRFLPQHKAVPYVRAPEEMTPGLPLYFSSTLTRAGYGMGVLVESHEGRPTKIEGNPNHPASLGATDLWAQAEILGMYDPDRSQDVRSNGEVSSWDEFWDATRRNLQAVGSNGASIALLTETVTSPTLTALINRFLALHPGAKWYQYEPVNRDSVYAGTQAAFGRPLNPVYKLDAAKVIVSLDSDFLLTDGPNTNVRMARDFSKGRRVRKGVATMNRLYTFESSYTITGASADHRWGVKPSQIDGIARALYAAVSGAEAASAPEGVDAKAFDAMVKDLNANKGAAVVIPGDSQPPSVHALAQAINAALGASGTTVAYTEPIEANPGNQTKGLEELTNALKGGTVKTLFVLGGNPVYNAPSDFGFFNAKNPKESLLAKVPFVAHLGTHEDETSRFATWHLPLAHPLEAWGDVRAFDGTASIVQPLIAPLYEGRSVLEVLSHLVNEPKNGYDLLVDHWKPQATGDWTTWWQTTLVKGVVAGTAAPTVTPTAVSGVETAMSAPAKLTGSFEVALRLDPSIYDGRYANNSWLQEAPKPITTITWDNAAHISPNTAKKLGLVNGGGNGGGDTDATDIAQVTGKRMITVTVGGASVDMPVWVLPGQPDDVITAHLGFGRWSAGQVGNDQGFNTYVLRTSQGLSFASGDAKATNDTYNISTTQPHHTMRGINERQNRPVVFASTFTEFTEKQGKVLEEEEVEHTPSATGFPGHVAEKTEGQGNSDGSLGQPTNLAMSAQNNDEQIPADEYRQEWNYVKTPGSNDKGWDSLYPEFSNKGYNAWGMGIDLTTCIGCNSCVIACQSENNIPTVGKDQVGRGREMHWIRIDHYYEGEDWNNVESHFQPVACVHCEKAPCEPVCPVAATIHSHEGLNQMVYNRCIGTRYCSNNCPYKVRRFNFLKWTAGLSGKTTLNYDLPVLKMLANPEVTIRGRGVMEKCTYCVQRINAVRIDAKKAGREIQDGEIKTACQQVCPTEAIVFGDLNNPNSDVSNWRKEPHQYLLLSELNTRPRTNYLTRIKNPNPEIVGTAAA